MALTKVVIALMTISVFVLSTAIPRAQAQYTFPAPAPAPASDGTSIDQGVAYVLMLVALVLTYLIHPMDAPSYNFFQA